VVALDTGSPRFVAGDPVSEVPNNPGYDGYAKQDADDDQHCGRLLLLTLM
jgi:hypothetical protein